jgi:hypothetical protein
VRGRKFDIRLWVLVTHAGPPSSSSRRRADGLRSGGNGSGSPLCVWGFSDCYLRLSAKPFAMNNLNDRSVHLCNYSVQKDNPNGDNHGSGSTNSSRSSRSTGEAGSSGNDDRRSSVDEVEVVENMAAARSFAKWCDATYGAGCWLSLMRSVRALVLTALLAARPSLKRRGKRYIAHT